MFDIGMGIFCENLENYKNFLTMENGQQIWLRKLFSVTWTSI